PTRPAGCCRAMPCRRAPWPERGRLPAADSSPSFERLARRELLAPAVVQIAEAQRLAARQLQAGHAQRALAAGDFQSVLVGGDDLAGPALPRADPSGMNLHRRAFEAGVADRPGMEGAYQTRQLDGRARPVDARFLLVQLVRVGRQGIVLRLACQRTGLQSGNRLDHCLRAELGEPIMQAAAGI